MRKFWLLDQHQGTGPTALVATNGSLQVIAVERFGPGITELADQQAILDEVLGRVAPTLKPFVAAGELAEEGESPHDDLELPTKAGQRGGRAGTAPTSARGGRVAGGPSNKGSRGDR